MLHYCFLNLRIFHDGKKLHRPLFKTNNNFINYNLQLTEIKLIKINMIIVIVILCKVKCIFVVFINYYIVY